MKNEHFVAIPNKMFAFDSKYFVTCDELMVYFQLGRLVHARDPRYTIISVDMLNSIIEFDVNNQARGKKRVKTALLSLKDKGYIEISYDKYELKNSSPIEVFFPELNDDVFTENVKSGNWTYVGFTQVNDDMFNRTETIEEFIVLIYVKWRSFENDTDRKYAISYSEWEQVLNVSHQTAVKIIKMCCQKNLIKKYRGDYYINLDGKIRQETNKYEVKEEPSINMFDLHKEINTVSNSMTNESKSVESREHNWFKNGDESKLNENDMYVFMSTKCSVLKKHAQKRIDGLRKTDGGSKLVEYLEKSASKKISDERLKKTKPKYSQNDLDEIESYLRYDPRPYINKKNENDLSDILGDD